MQGPTGVGTGPRLLSFTRIGFTVLAVVALITGYLGLWQYLADTPGAGLGRGQWDLLYYDLQLFVLGSAPVSEGGPYPWLLQFARFAAPATTAYALFEAGQALLAGELRRLRQQLRRGHVVVTGDTTVARALAAKLRASGRRVIMMPTGDATTLRAAGIARARALYACEDDASDSGANVATALAAAQQLPLTTRLAVYAQVSDAQLCLALQARRLALPEAEPLHLEFFNVEQLAARELMRGEDLDVPEGTPHLTVVGKSTFAYAAVVEYARQWRVRGPRPAERVEVTIVDGSAIRMARALTRRHRLVEEVCRLQPVQLPLEEYLRTRAGQAAHRVYLCHQDERLALRTAVATSRLWAGGAGSVVVRLHQLDHHSGAFHRPGRYLLDDLGGRLRLVGVTQLACAPVVIEEGLVEQLAQAIHEHYLVAQQRRGKPLGAGEAMRPWQSPTGRSLPDGLKDANRAQARHIGRKLASIDCAVVPRTGRGPDFAFRETEVEQLARLEHARWLAERTAAGWVYAPVLAPQQRQHPCLVPWSQLSEPERTKDRDTIWNLPDILAQVGLEIVRLR